MSGLILGTIAFNHNMDTILYQLAEKISFHIGFDDAAGKIDGQDVFKADDGTVGTGGKGLPHIDIEAFDMGFHLLRYLEGAHIGEACRGVLILYPG